MENATVFKGTSKTIQNELFKRMLTVCQKEISLKINKLDYLTITADETINIYAVFQIVIVYRYIVNDKLIERFWAYLNPKVHNAQAVSECVEKLTKHIEN